MTKYERQDISLAPGLSITINRSAYGIGFVLWKDKKCIVDASCFTKDKRVRVSDEFSSVTGTDTNECNGCLIYEFKKRGKANNSPAIVRPSTGRTTKPVRKPLK